MFKRNLFYIGVIILLTIFMVNCGEDDKSPITNNTIPYNPSVSGTGSISISIAWPSKSKELTTSVIHPDVTEIEIIITGIGLTEPRIEKILQGESIKTITGIPLGNKQVELKGKNAIGNVLSHRITNVTILLDTSVPINAYLGATIFNTGFYPSNIPISLGDTLYWINNDTVAHTVSADNTTFDSGNINPGEVWAYQFNSEGTFNYHCENTGIIGTIVVGPPLTNTPVPVATFTPLPTPTNQPSPNINSIINSFVREGDWITVSGYGFGDSQGIGTVKINNIDSNIVNWTNTAIGCIVPNGAFVGNGNPVSFEVYTSAGQLLTYDSFFVTKDVGFFLEFPAANPVAFFPVRVCFDDTKNNMYVLGSIPPQPPSVDRTEIRKYTYPGGSLGPSLIINRRFYDMTYCNSNNRVYILITDGEYNIYSYDSILSNSFSFPIITWQESNLKWNPVYNEITTVPYNQFYKYSTLGNFNGSFPLNISAYQPGGMDFDDDGNIYLSLWHSSTFKYYVSKYNYSGELVYTEEVLSEGDLVIDNQNDLLFITGGQPSYYTIDVYSLKSGKPVFIGFIIVTAYDSPTTGALTVIPGNIFYPIWVGNPVELGIRNYKY